MMRSKTLLGVAAAALLAAGCGAEPAKPAAGGSGPVDAPAPTAVLRWTAIPDTDAQALKAKYTSISTYLADRLGVKVEYVPVADYKASVEGFKSGDLQLAWFGGLTGVQARAAVPGARAIAQGAEDPEYKSYFIAHADTGIEPSEEFPTELGGVAFSFGSESSTSGRLMPEYFLRKITGKSPKDFFTAGFSFSGAHDKTARLVQEGGAVKAGVLSYTTYDKMVERGELDPGVCRIVWTTPFYADYNFTAHPRLEEMFGEGTIQRLQDALVAMDDKQLLDAFPRSAIIPAENADFAAIEDVARELGLLR